MTIDQELRLSYYQQVADIHAEHGISLVHDLRDQKFYVKKRLTVYNANIYYYLMAHPIPNTPKILLAEEDGKILTVIEEYIPGDTLEELLEKQGVLSEAQVLDIAIQLCKILSDFHGCTPAIVNRDIKPSNIKISPDGVVKLLDMNAAKWSSDRAEKDTVLLGTQGYAAPEQYGFGSSNVQTDIYALGVLMNELLTGQFPGRILAEGKLRPVIRRCTELSPERRYPSVRDLQIALTAIRDGQNPITSDWRRFLPPGFRKLRIGVNLLAALGYFFFFWMCSVLEVEDATPGILLLNRMTFGIAGLGMILFSGNYLDVQSKIGIRRWKNPILRFFGIVVTDALILFFCVMILSLVEALIQ